MATRSTKKTKTTKTRRSLRLLPGNSPPTSAPPPWPMDRLAVLLAWLDEGGDLATTEPDELDAYAREEEHFVARRAEWQWRARHVARLLMAPPASEEQIAARWREWNGEEKVAR